MKEQRQWEEDFLSKVYEKLFWVTDEVKALKPYTTAEGRYGDAPDDRYPWFCGFWGGIQWWLYQYSGNEKFLQKAKAVSENMHKGLTDFVSS